MDRDTFLREAAAACERSLQRSVSDGPPVTAAVAGPAVDGQSDPASAAPAASWVPLEDPAHALLAPERKLPRRLHLWFAAVLGALAGCAALAQTLLVHPHTSAVPSRSGDSVPADSEAPPLHILQQALSADGGPSLPVGGAAGAGSVGGVGGAGGAGGASLPAVVRAAGAATALAEPVGSPPDPAGSDLLAGETDPAATVPGELLQLPGLPGAGQPVARPDATGAARRALSTSVTALPANGAAVDAADPSARLAQEKARSLIAGSRILAISHISPTLADAAAGSATGQSASSGGSGSSSSGSSGALASLLRGGDLAAAPGLFAAAGAWLRQSLPASRSETGDLAVSGGSGGGSPSAAPLPAGPLLQPRAAHGGWVVLEGTSIPCVLVNELRSDLPGMILAQVSQDVFDSVQGRVRLIPRGTRLVGRYDSQVAAGQERVLASFHRLIFPDGSSIDLTRMEGADAGGGAGLEDQVNTHFWKRFGLSFLTAGVARVADRNAANASSAGGLLPGPDAAGQILLDTARNGLQSTGPVPPTVVIRHGTAFVVMVNRDLALPALDGEDPP